MSTPDPDPLVVDLWDVGARVRARTRLDDGTELGTFTEETSPPASEVLEFISDAVGEVRLSLKRAELTSEQIKRARALVSLRAAMDVEMSYRPDEPSAAFDYFERRYGRGLELLLDDLDDSAPGVTRRGARYVLVPVADGLNDPWPTP